MFCPGVGMAYLNVDGEAAQKQLIIFDRKKEDFTRQA
jgi:hypothetical protein